MPRSTSSARFSAKYSRQCSSRSAAASSVRVSRSRRNSLRVLLVEEDRLQAEPVQQHQPAQAVGPLDRQGVVVVVRGARGRRGPRPSGYLAAQLRPRAMGRRAAVGAGDRPAPVGASGGPRRVRRLLPGELAEHAQGGQQDDDGEGSLHQLQVLRSWSVASGAAARPCGVAIRTAGPRPRRHAAPPVSIGNRPPYCLVPRADRQFRLLGTSRVGVPAPHPTIPVRRLDGNHDIDRPSAGKNGQFSRLFDSWAVLEGSCPHRSPPARGPPRRPFRECSSLGAGRLFAEILESSGPGAGRPHEPAADPDPNRSTQRPGIPSSTRPGEVTPDGSTRSCPSRSDPKLSSLGNSTISSMALQSYVAVSWPKAGPWRLVILELGSLGKTTVRSIQRSGYAADYEAEPGTCPPSPRVPGAKALVGPRNRRVHYPVIEQDRGRRGCRSVSLPEVSLSHAMMLLRQGSDNGRGWVTGKNRTRFASATGDPTPGWGRDFGRARRRHRAGRERKAVLTAFRTIEYTPLPSQSRERPRRPGVPEDRSHNRDHQPAGFDPRQCIIVQGCVRPRRV